MSKFKVGDKVKIRKDSEYYGDGVSNPIGIRGRIRHINVPTIRLLYSVDWDNGTRNTYSYSDLDFWGYPINPVNKLLYPDYEEKDGYLVPKEKYENS